MRLQKRMANAVVEMLEDVDFAKDKANQFKHDEHGELKAVL